MSRDRSRAHVSPPTDVQVPPVLGRVVSDRVAKLERRRRQMSFLSVEAYPECAEPDILPNGKRRR